jgi:hypothetical protein
MFSTSLSVRTQYLMEKGYDPMSRVSARVAWARRVLLFVCLVSLLVPMSPESSAAVITNDAFARTWARTDKPVADLLVNRTWMWGNEAFTDEIPETYAQAPGGSRKVQYFDKSRMEINHDTSIAVDSPWHVTNGLLVVELMTGQMQLGDSSFDPRSASEASVAGDQDQVQGVTYRFMGFLRDEPADPVGTVINRILTPGAATNMYLFSDRLGGFGITATRYVPETDHTVASVFWEFMTSWGTVHEGGQFVNDQLFLDPFYATGLPITEAYWANVKLAGVQADVLVQCFERRCLTYTPSNPDGWKVEAGNVGQHYYAWRYGQNPPPLNPEPGDGYEWATTWNGRYQPTRMDTDSAGNLYVIDAGYSSVVSYSPSGNVRFTIDGSTLGTRVAMDVSVASDGRSDHVFVLTRSGAAYQTKVIVYDVFGTYLHHWDVVGAFTETWPGYPSSIDADGFGNVTIVSPHEIARFSWNGTFLGALQEADRAFRDVAVSGVSGDIYVASGQTVRRYDLTGRLLTIWNEPGGAVRVDIDRMGRVYVLDESNFRVVRMSSAGEVETSFASYGTGNGQITEGQHGFAISESGIVYLSDASTNRIHVFHPK